MKITFTTLYFLLFLVFKNDFILAQCPTIGAPPANTPKGRFEVDFKGVKYQGDGTLTKITMCTNGTFTVTNRSGNNTGIRYYFQAIRTPNNFPNTNQFVISGANPITNISIPGTPGNYILIQIRVNTANNILAYICQPIEIVASPPGPVFSLSSCASLRGQIDIPTNTTNSFDSYIINWGDGSPNETVTKAQLPIKARPHTFPNINGRTVTVTGIKAGVLCDGVTRLPITPNGASVAPRMFSIQVQDNDTIQLRYQGGNFTYDFYQKSGTANYRIVRSITSPPNTQNTLKIPVKDANKDQYCFKVGIIDACQRPTFSDSTCSIPFQVSALNKKNFLKWKAIDAKAFLGYRVFKNNNFTIPLRTITRNTTDTLTDSPVICGTNYTYQIIGISGPGGQTQSISRNIQVMGVDSTKPPVITNVLVSVVKDKVEIQVGAIPVGQNLKSFSFYRWKNNALELFNSGGNGSRVTDDQSNPSKKAECYIIKYENRCGIFSDTSAAFCTSFLSLQSAGIKWTPYQKFPTGLNAYFVEKLDDKGTILSSSRMAANVFSFDPDPASIDPNNPVIKFRIRALGLNNQNSYSNEVFYAQKLLLYLPNAFTPNGDGKNDLFVINAIFVNTFKIRIFNRTGSMVFQSDDYKTFWDGTKNGTPVPPDSYFYEIIATDFKGEVTKKSGGVTVLR